MTRAEEQALLREYLDRCARLALGLERSVERVGGLLPITAEGMKLLSIEDEDIVLAFLKRFEQFEDTLGRTLKAVDTIMAYGKVERQTPVDIARRAWALGILDSERVWGDAVRARNTLVHEYPLRPEKRAEQVNTAWTCIAALKTTWAAIQRFVDVEGLLT